MRTAVVALLIIVAFFVGALLTWRIVRVSAPTADPTAPSVVAEPSQPQTLEPPAPAQPSPPPAADEVAEMDDVESTLSTVSGTVTDARTGKPIAGAEIADVMTIEQTTFGFETNPDAEPVDVAKLRTTSDAEGRYQLVIDRNRTYALSCSATGKSTASSYLEGPTEEKTVTLDFSLGDGGTIVGEVLDRDAGTPVAGIRITAQNAYSFAASSSDAEGKFELKGLAPGNYQPILAAQKVGYLFNYSQVPMVTVTSNSTSDKITLYVVRGGTITGTVKSDTGEPVAKAWIWAGPDEENYTGDPLFESLGSVTTDANGAYTLPGVPLGRTVVVTANHEEWAFRKSDPQVLDPASPSTTVDFVFPQGVSISGKGVRPDGAPAIEQDVLLTSVDEMDPNSIWRNATTDAQGGFTFKNVPAGSYIIGDMEVTMPERRAEAAVVNVVAGRNINGLTVEVRELSYMGEPDDPAATITGTVLDATGAPAKDVNIRALKVEDGMVMSDQMSDEKGAFSLYVEAGQNYTLYAESDDGEAIQENVQAGTSTSLRLGSVTELAGKVVQSDGQIVPGARVNLLPEGGVDPQQGYFKMMSDYGNTMTETDQQGRFSFKHIAPAQYTLKVVAPGIGAGTSEPVTISRGETRNDVVVTMVPGVQFAGTVVDASNRPVAGANVGLRPVNTEEQNEEGDMVLYSDQVSQYWDLAGAAISGADGTFKIVGVPSGEFSLYASHQDYCMFVDKKVLIGSSNHSGYVVHLTKGGAIKAEYRGTGASQSGVYITIESDEGATKDGQTDASGNCLLERVIPGSYRVSAVNFRNNDTSQEEGFIAATQRRDVNVVDGQTATVQFTGGANVRGTVVGDLSKTYSLLLLRAGAPESIPEAYQAWEYGDDFYRHVAAEGQAINGKFVISGVEPGEYSIHLYVMRGNAPEDEESEEEITETEFGQRLVNSQLISVGSDGAEVTFDVGVEEEVAP